LRVSSSSSASFCCSSASLPLSAPSSAAGSGRVARPFGFAPKIPGVRNTEDADETNPSCPSRDRSPRVRRRARGPAKGSAFWVGGCFQPEMRSFWKAHTSVDRTRITPAPMVRDAAGGAVRPLVASATRPTSNSEKRATAVEAQGGPIPGKHKTIRPVCRLDLPAHLPRGASSVCQNATSLVVHSAARKISHGRSLLASGHRDLVASGAASLAAFVFLGAGWTRVRASC
jgi:hypothetical protein